MVSFGMSGNNNIANQLHYKLYDFYGPFYAEGNPTGVKACLETPLDLVLCDVKMAGIDGYGVLRLLTEDESTANIPFVFITAKTEPEEIRRGMDLGADGYITKPFYKDELLRVIRTHLNQRA